MGDLNAKQLLGRVPTIEEYQFRKWYDDISRKLDLNPNADDPENYYDYRGFYNAMKRGEVQAPTQVGQHWDSRFKSPDHPRRYLEDPINSRFFDTESGAYTGGKKEMVPEKRMDLINNVDTPDLSKDQWQQARAGADRDKNEHLLDPWNESKATELLDPWKAKP